MSWRTGDGLAPLKVAVIGRSRVFGALPPAQHFKRMDGLPFGLRRFVLFAVLVIETVATGSHGSPRRRSRSAVKPLRRPRLTVNTKKCETGAVDAIPTGMKSVNFIYFFLGASLLFKEETEDGCSDASSGLVLSGPLRRLARRRFSQAIARRDNTVPRHSKPCRNEFAESFACQKFVPRAVSLHFDLWRTDGSSWRLGNFSRIRGEIERDETRTVNWTQTNGMWIRERNEMFLFWIWRLQGRGLIPIG